MRPLVLNPLFASLTSLPGVGPKLEQLYARLLDHAAPRVVDLLFHLPSGAIDRRTFLGLTAGAAGAVLLGAVIGLGIGLFGVPLLALGLGGIVLALAAMASYWAKPS